MLNLVRYEVDGRQVFDLAVASPDAAEAANQAAASVVYAALFTDARAPADRVADSRRGWWANPDAGSGLWHVRRQALGSSARLEALETVRQALAERPALSDVAVQDVTPVGSVSVVAFDVSGKHNGQAFSISLSF
jgi:phage gp46-like protein